MRNRRTLLTLYAVNLLNSVGAWFFIPLLPIFLGRRGGSAALVGVVLAAGLLANAAIRYPMGWAADRFGTRTILVAGSAANACFFLAYLLPLPLPAFVLLRLVHGAAEGAFGPPANGLVADVTDARDRGRAFGYMQATFMAGLLIGPAVGGFIALLNLGLVFGAAAALTAATVIALATLPNVRKRSTVEVPTNALRIARVLLPFILLGAGTAYMGGAYDTVWSLYLTQRGATTFAVGLSFASFALPAMLLSGYAGTVGDRFGTRRIAVVALLFTAFFAALYPFIASVPWLIGLGLIDGMFTISGMPSLTAEVSRSSDPGQQARAQGVFQTAQTVTQIAGALAGGALFSLNPTYAFLSISAVCVAGALTAFVPPAAFVRMAEQPQ